MSRLRSVFIFFDACQAVIMTFNKKNKELQCVIKRVLCFYSTTTLHDSVYTEPELSGSKVRW